MGLQRRAQIHFSFTLAERQALIITSFVGAIILFLFVWRTTNHTLLSGLFDFLFCFIIAGISMFIFVAIPKLVAIQNGYEATYTSWLNGLLVGFVVSFLSYGILPIILPGNITINTIDRLRHGKVYFGENKKDIFKVLASAPVVALFVAAVFAFLSNSIGSDILFYGTIFNVIIAFFSLVPFPENIGSTLYFAKKENYYYLAGFILFFLIVIISQSALVLFGLLLLILLVLLIILLKKKKKK